MSTTRFAFLNRIETALLLNGTGGGAPARDEVAGFLMENVKNSDRHQLWKQSTGAGTLLVDFDLMNGVAGDVGINIGALLGHRPTTKAGSGVTSCIIKSQTHAVGYAPAGAWTTLDTVSMANRARDGGQGFADATIRYIRFEMTVADAFTLGRLFIGAVEMDLLTRGSQPPDGAPTRDYVRPVRENGVVGDARVRTFGGDRYERLSVPFSADTTLRNKLIALLDKQQTVVYLDHADTFKEMFVQRLSEVTVFEGASASRYQMQLDMVQLG